MTERRLTTAALAAFVIGVGLMVPFEGTLVRIAGVLCLFAFIVLGVFAIATPERLEEMDEVEAGGSGGATPGAASGSS